METTVTLTLDRETAEHLLALVTANPYDGSIGEAWRHDRPMPRRYLTRTERAELRNVLTDQLEEV
jgi:hypothetical protein